MADGDGNGRRITVSEETLRLALSEMELRLRIYFDGQLQHKAERNDLTELARKLDALDRGDFTPVHERALEAFIEQRAAVEADRGWTKRERVMGVIAILLSILTLIGSIYFGVRAAAQSVNHGGDAPVTTLEKP